MNQNGKNCLPCSRNCFQRCLVLRKLRNGTKTNEICAEQADAPKSNSCEAAITFGWSSPFPASVGLAHRAVQVEDPLIKRAMLARRSRQPPISTDFRPLVDPQSSGSALEAGPTARRRGPRPSPRNRLQSYRSERLTHLPLPPVSDPNVGRFRLTLARGISTSENRHGAPGRRF